MAADSASCWKKAAVFLGEQGFGENFNGNLAFEGFLKGYEDSGHGAVPQFFQQHGSADLLADQIIQIELSDGSHCS